MGEVARGSMGVVYRARDRKRKREIALKLLLSDLHDDDEGHERFKREARSLARLNHPGIVKVFDYGVHKGLPYLTMEFVPGKTLQSLLETNALRLLPGVDVLLKVANAIDHAHSRGVVHRDLKPANVLIGSDNRARISDFGLAKLEDGRITLTQDGDIVGTPLYMSPEQIQGALAQVGPSSDVWALGVMLYRVLTGSLPFNGTTVEEVSQAVVNSKPVPPRTWVPDVPADLEQVCFTALNKHPADRYQSAGEFARDLGAYLQGRPVLAGRVTPAMRARRAYRALRIHAPTLLPGLLTVLILGMLAGWLAMPASTSDPSAGANARLTQAEAAWTRRAYDQADELLERMDALPSEDTDLLARRAALEARLGESLSELETAVRTLGRAEDALALATVAAREGDLPRLSLAAEVLPKAHPQRAWLEWIMDRGPAPVAAARLLGDPQRSADAREVPPLERARAALASGGFRLASANLAPLLERDDMEARVVEAEGLLQRGFPRAARSKLAALPREQLPRSLAHTVELNLLLSDLGSELPRALAELAERAPNLEQKLICLRWAALAGGGVSPGTRPVGPASLRLVWLRAAVAAQEAKLRKLLVARAEGSQGPEGFTLEGVAGADPLGLPPELHDPLLRAQVVVLRLGGAQDVEASVNEETLQGDPSRPDVNGVRGPLAFFLAARGSDSAGLAKPMDASPGCDPWPLRIADASLAVHDQARERDPERAEAALDRAQRAIDLALAINPFHRRARLVSAHVSLKRCADELAGAARERLRQDVAVAALLWPRDPAVASWIRIRDELFGLTPQANPFESDPLLDLARLAASGGLDPLDEGPRGAPAHSLAVDLVQTNLMRSKELSPALSSYRERVASNADDEALNVEQRTRWEAVAVALDPSRLDSVLLNPPHPALADGDVTAVDRVARVLRQLALIAQGEALPEGWVTQARSDVSFARRRWPTLGLEAITALVELAATPREPSDWPEVVLEPWSGEVGNSLSLGRTPPSELGSALKRLAALGTP